MRKDVWIAGSLGGGVMLVWIFVSNAVVPLKSRMIHRIAPNQLEVHEALKRNIREPGTYSCLYLTREQEEAMPDYRSQPIYSITYSGSTHGDRASAADFLPIPLIFAATTTAAWMLSAASRRARSTYLRRVVFVALFGVIVALHGDLLQLGLGPQPGDYLVFLAINDVIGWTLVGLVAAACVKSRSAGSGAER